MAYLRWYYWEESLTHQGWSGLCTKNEKGYCQRKLTN